jgi:PEP-CTERM motif
MASVRLSKTKVVCMLLVAGCSISPSQSRASALYALGVGLTVDASTSDAVAATTTYYDLDGTTNTRFLPASLGVSINTDQGGSLLLSGANGKTWQAPADNAQSVTLFYRVFETGTANASRPTFSSYNLLYQNQWNPDGNINKYWASTSSPGTVNLLTGLSPGAIATPKNYTIEFYGSSFMTYSGGSFTAFDNNAGNNYTTSFQLVPEPSTAGLLAFSIVGAFALRRRRS